jgi:hypothetical protein
MIDVSCLNDFLLGEIDQERIRIRKYLISIIYPQ